MTDEESKKYSKPKVICPFCQERQPNGNFRAFAVNGMSMHVRMQHPDKYDEYQTHRDKYIKKFACDDEGNLIGQEPDPEPEPVVEQEVISEQTHVDPPAPAPTPAPTPAPMKTPKQKPEPEPKSPKKESFPAKSSPEPKSEKYEYNPYEF